jgi:hypothetical protein
MKIQFKGQEITLDQIEVQLKQAAGDFYDPDMLVVLKCGLANPDLLPKFTIRRVELTTFPEYTAKWVERYLGGFRNRPSLRMGNPSSTIPDTLVSFIYNQLHTELSKEQVSVAAYAHSTMMTIENIVGDMLEEFLSIKLKPKGWVCCWGTTIKAVDFCHSDGTLLQIKTSDNSENSSSSAVRNGTNISKWCRRKSQQLDGYYWEGIQELTGETSLNETEFRKFVKVTLDNNPACVYIKQN